jgi:hypothetical protein
MTGQPRLVGNGRRDILAVNAPGRARYSPAGPQLTGAIDTLTSFPDIVDSGYILV